MPVSNLLLTDMPLRASVGRVAIPLPFGSILKQMLSGCLKNIILNYPKYVSGAMKWCV
ncbi:MAG: hypothetical protein IJV35_01645 [Neisseriaceae bacterium]|nr:hypothetical protein [Neisseriaceae bacterium]